MSTARLQRASEALVDAQREFTDALVEALGRRVQTEPVAQANTKTEPVRQSAKAAAAPAQAAPPRQANRRPGPTLPASMTPAARKPEALSEETRAESLTEGRKLVADIIKVIKRESPAFPQALEGQLALNRIPFDKALVQQLLSEA